MTSSIKMQMQLDHCVVAVVSRRERLAAILPLLAWPFAALPLRDLPFAALPFVPWPFSARICRRASARFFFSRSSARAALRFFSQEGHLQPIGFKYSRK